MQAHLFYTTSTQQTVPLFLLSTALWEEKRSHLSAVEQNYFALHEFKAKIGESCFISNADGLLEAVYVGAEEGQWGQALAYAASCLPPQCYQLHNDVSEPDLLQWALSQYRFDKYKKNELQPRLLVVSEKQLPAISALVDAQFRVRDLINEPTNSMGPEQLANTLEHLAHQYEAEFEQWVDEELLAHNYPAIHAVGRASEYEPRLLSLKWGNPQHPKVTLVGKGVCFDTGGLDLKPAFAMRYMKKDMGGAAHVIGLAQWIMATKLPICLQVFIPAVENAIGPHAFRPGDVLTMRNGKTVEVDNTDAEGRLVLADALVKACEESPSLLIDFSTLTGAARVAVGTEIAAVFSNDDEVVAKLYEASAKSVDPVWRLPLFKAYEDCLRSSVADMSNSSDHPYAGAIVGALFLQRFIKPEISWLHFDVMAWNLRTKPGKPEGGEAMGVRAMAYYLQEMYGA